MYSSYSKFIGTASYEGSQTFALGSLADKSTDLHAGTRSRQTRQSAAHLQWIASCLVSQGLGGEGEWGHGLAH